ncbi:MAG: FHA domain-containing protein [Clostridium sp.]|nr:FHA domain-containing protein [Clostridium sp.]
MEDEFIKNNDIIKHKIDDVSDINMINLETANKNKQLGFIEIEIEQFNSDVSLIYNIKGCKTLKDYLLNPLSKDKAYSLIRSINNSLLMQSYILDTGVVNLKTNLVFVKEINNIPYCYFIYVPYNNQYVQDKEDVKKLIFSIIISIENNELRNEVLKLYSMDNLDEVINILKVEDINFIEHKKEPVLEVKNDAKERVEEGFTLEVSEDETTLFDDDDYEETTLIDEDDFNTLDAKLLINNNGVFSEEYLSMKITTLGRSKTSDIVISNKVISKKHAQILKQKSDFFIIDMESTNGTFVNNRKLRRNEKVKLKSKDKIKLGNVCLSFER